MNAAELTNKLQNICHDGHAKKRVTINGHRVTSVKITDGAVEITTDERRPETCARHFLVPRLWAGVGMPPEPVTAEDLQGAESCHERYRCPECRFYEPREKKA